MPSDLFRRALPAMLVLTVLAASSVRADLPKLPDGFECRLVASVPAVEFPCQVATAPGGDLFIAEDPMDQVGPYESDNGRILLFREGQDPLVFAEGLRAVFGMAWHDGALYVMHMPYLSIFRDTNGDGKSDERKDLFKDLGPGPKPGALNDHIVSGLQFGIDGWLYIAVGDKGVPGATRPEDGVTVQLKGGGTLRCRPDGTELEVYSSGTRNHLEPNLDDRDNLFTYDNTDDGDGWWTRVTHHVDGGYYGYPYDYHDRTDRMLPRMAEYGGGSPCGALFYREDAWPESYRGLGYWAEWGKGKVQAIRFRPKGASFEVAELIDFMVPRPGDNFHPIDLALSFDGKTLYVADWNMGGWGNKEEKVGRVFAVTYKGDAENGLAPIVPSARGTDSDPIEKQFEALSHPSYNERMRAQAVLIKKGREILDQVLQRLLPSRPDSKPSPPLAQRHLVWILDAIAGGSPDATLPLIDCLGSPIADVRTQAARALGERRAPLDLAVERLMERAKADPDPTVRLQAIIALGRIGNPMAVPVLLPVLADSDLYLAFIARVALRRIGDWKAAAEGLHSDDQAIRLGVLAAMEQQYNIGAVEALIAYALSPDHPANERAKALQFVAEVHRKAKPWDGSWWGTRPTHGKPPAKVDEWQGTPLVLDAIRRGLTDPAPEVRLAAIADVRETDDKEALPKLVDRFQAEDHPEVRAAIAVALGQMKHKPALPLLVNALKDVNAPDSVREAALSGVEAIGTDEATKALVDLLGRDDLPVDRQPRVIIALGRFRAKAAVPRLLETLKSASAPVRAASAEALGRIGQTQEVLEPLRARLDDADLSVRKAVISALADLEDREAVPALIRAAESDDTRFEATLALADVADIRALQVYLRGLNDKNQEIRQASSKALSEIREPAASVLDKLAERRELPSSVIPELRKIYTAMQPLTQWKVIGPFDFDAKPTFGPDGSVDLKAPQTGKDGKSVTWRPARPADRRGQINLDRIIHGDNRSAFGYTEIDSPTARKAQMAVGSDDTITVWVNGKQVFEFDRDRGFSHEQDRFDVDLQAGTNHIVIKCGNHGGGWQYAVAVGAAAEYAFLKAPATGGFDPEAFKAFAMDAKGRPERGRSLFADLKGLACVKCHKVAGQGGSVGPDLSGVGAKYRREELIESVLYPSAKIFSGYEPVVVATVDGRVLTGIVKSDDDSGLVLQDADDKSVTIAKDDIDERRTSDVSLMPNGLAEGLSKEDFADLISYLETLKEAAPGSESKAAGER